MNGFLLFAGLCVMQCSPTRQSPDLAGGTSTQTGNGMVSGILYRPGGTAPANSAFVFVRKRTVFADISRMLEKKITDTVMTDDSGRFTIDSIDTGTYVIEATDGGNNFAILDSVQLEKNDSTVILPPDTLEPAGAIKGTVRLSEGGDPRKVFAIIAAIDRFTTADSDGAFGFERLAEGRYTVTILPTLDDYGVFDTMNVPVKSADTTDLGAIVLPFTGIPAVRNLTASYDTLQQRVTLRWSGPVAAHSIKFNIYRRAIDTVASGFLMLNNTPVDDTVFMDSRCVQNNTYEYRVTAQDSLEKEGGRSPPIRVGITQYDIVPRNAALAYDTVKQTATLRWSNPDTSRVKSYNVYRRNVELNETFWTPFNNRPVSDTIFIDSTFNLCPLSGGSCDDTLGRNNPSYEYCVAALIHDVREGKRSAGMPLRISTTYLAPKKVNFTYDTVLQRVHLRWNKPDMTIVRGFAVYRRTIDTNEAEFSPISDVNQNDTFYSDSTAGQNKFYEYCVASVVKNNRAEVKSAGVKVHVAASFVEEAVFINGTGGQGNLGFPNDIAVASNGDLYIVDQGNGRIQVFDSTMRYLRQIGGGILDYPLKVCIDDDRVFAADYNRERDYGAMYVFDGAGAVVDTILDSVVINDCDAGNGSLYTVIDGRTIATYSYAGNKKRSWQVSGQDGGKGIVAGSGNGIFVSTGLIFPDKNKIIAFDSLGSAAGSVTVPFYPHAMAFDAVRQQLYVICYNGTHGSVLHVVDRSSNELARYKIQSDDQNISIGIEKNGAVFIVLKNEGKIIKLKPSAVF